MILNEVDEQFEDEGMIFGVNPEVGAVVLLALFFQEPEAVFGDEDVHAILPSTEVRHSLCFGLR